MVDGTSYELIIHVLFLPSVSSTLQEVIHAIVILEKTAADIQANASSYFSVDSGGLSYFITSSTLTLKGNINCPVGSVSDDGVCGKLCVSLIFFDKFRTSNTNITKKPSVDIIL